MQQVVLVLKNETSPARISHWYTEASGAGVSFKCVFFQSLDADFGFKRWPPPTHKSALQVGSFFPRQTWILPLFSSVSSVPFICHNIKNKLLRLQKSAFENIFLFYVFPVRDYGMAAHLFAHLYRTVGGWGDKGATGNRLCISLRNHHGNVI